MRWGSKGMTVGAPGESCKPVRNGRYKDPERRIRFGAPALLICAAMTVLLLSPPSASASDMAANESASVQQTTLTAVSGAIGTYSTAVLDHISLARQADQSGSIDITFESTTYTLELRPTTVVANDVRAPSDIYRYVENRHFAGTVRGFPESSARVSFDEHGVTACVSLQGREFYMCPADIYDRSAAPGTEIIYSSSDIVNVPGNARYDWNSDQSASAAAEIGPAPASEPLEAAPLVQGSEPVVLAGNASSPSMSFAPLVVKQQTMGYRVLRMYAGTDNQFRASYDNAYIENRVNTVNQWYQQVGVQIIIVNYFAWSHDSNGDPTIDDCLGDFRTAVRAQAQRNYDDSNLFCGRDWSVGGGYVVGAAYIRGAETGLFESDRAQYGFSITSMNSRWTAQQKEETLSHQLGHTLNAVHDQADPSYGSASGTIMSNAATIWHWFSHGNNTASHNNAQRIRAWSAMNLHTIVWTQAGDDYGSTAADYLFMENLKVRVLDVPSSTDSILNVQFDLSWYPRPGVGGASTTVNQIYTSLRSPSYANRDFGVAGSIVIWRGGTYHYSSSGTSVALGEYGQWRVLAAYSYNGHYGAYYDDPVYVDRYYVLASTGGVTPAYHDDYVVDIAGETNTPGLLVWNFRVLSLTTNQPRVGNTVDVYWAAYNTNPQVYRTGGASFSMYVACQAPNGAWYDFGFQAGSNWVQRSTAQMGGGFNDLNQNNAGNPAGGNFEFFLTSSTLSQSGTWRLIPDILADAYYPWYGSEVHLVVNP